jgi:hypothetical protein
MKSEPRTKIKSAQSRRRRTVTQSISFDWEIYEIMEQERRKFRLEIPRSEFIRKALEEKFTKEGLL